jgi:hypothetical protein
VHSLSNGVLSLSKVVGSLLRAGGELLLLERSQAAAVASCFLLSQVPWRVLSLEASAGSSTTLLGEDGQNLGDALAEHSDLLEVDLGLGRDLLDTELRQLFLQKNKR